MLTLYMSDSRAIVENNVQLSIHEIAERQSRTSAEQQSRTTYSRATVENDEQLSIDDAEAD